jgi:hypothetical protein
VGSTIAIALSPYQETDSFLLVFFSYCLLIIRFREVSGKTQIHLPRTFYMKSTIKSTRMSHDHFSNLVFKFVISCRHVVAIRSRKKS